MGVRDLAAGTLMLPVACLWGTALAQDASAQSPDSFYRLGPDLLEQDGVPKGEIRTSGEPARPIIDHPVSTDPRDTTERSMRSPAARK